MSKARLNLIVASLLTLTATSAFAAGVDRVWVSGHGVDQSGCGAPTNPCRSLQYAHDNIVASGGEIDILDPAGYGSLTITKAISIVNDGVGTAGVQATAGNAITINAGPTDAVYLRGLNIDGVHFAGHFGILLNSAASFTMIDCVVRHFSSYGVYIQPSANFSFGLYNSFILDNEGFGVLYQPSTGAPTVYGIVDHVVSDGNEGGFNIGGSSGAIHLTVSNSQASNNTWYGLASYALDPGGAVVEIHDTTMDNNAEYGLWTEVNGVAHIARSVFDGNGINGIYNRSTPPGGVYSAADNHAEDNGSAATNGSIATSDTLY